MTPNEFRHLALNLPGVTERQHMNHPDFRVEGRIFATLGYPGKNWGMVKLTPEQQRSFISRATGTFRPCTGKWGEKGSTNVELTSAKTPIVRAALKTAWRNALKEKTVDEPATGSAPSKNRQNFQNRRDWVMFAGFARMQVWNSGGPINAPHERVLQLLIKAWDGDDESWTVYRHKSGAGKPGKIVFKKWNSDADKARFRSLGKKAAPKRWRDSVNVAVKQYPLSGRWVVILERRIESLSVPPITGPVKPLAREAEYTLSLWRSRQEALFSWNPPPPAAWRPLAKLFSVLLREFRRHAAGKPLGSVQELWPTKAN